MAESIVRLRVDSQEFESKLKRASQELLAMADNARRTGATFAIADKEELAFVQSLGQLQTSARSAKGSLAEMTKAFQDLSMHYRSLTAEEKAAPYGQELKKSLEQLQGRIRESKSALSDINGKIGESKGETNLLSGAVNELTGKLGINIPKLGALSVAVGAATAALKISKDAFFKNEQQLDEWGRTTESAKALYSGFLDSLNTGDISGYLQRINHIVDAARKAYDALDELGTFNAFNQVNVSRDKQRLTNAMADYREGKGSAEDVRSASQAVIANLREQYLKQQNAYVAKINQLAAERGVSGKALMQIANGSYADYLKAKNVQMTGVRYQVHTNQYGQQWTTTEHYAKNAAEKMGSALRRINDTDWQELQRLGADAQNTLNEIGMTRRQVARILGSGRTTATTGGGGSTGGGSNGGVGGNTNVIDVEKFAFKMNDNFDGGMLQDELNGKVADKVSEAITAVIKHDRQNIDPAQPKATLQGTETVNDVFKKADMRPDPYKNLNKEDSKKQENSMDKLAKGVGAISNITGALQNMGLKLPEGLTKTISVIQSLISIIQSVQTIISIFSTGSQVANTAAVTANAAATTALTTAMWANVGTSWIPFAHGGIAKRAANGFVGGNNYSGDIIPIAVNSGELILNRAQQGNLASQLSGMGMGNMRLSCKVNAKDIEFALNHQAGDTSRGRYVTSKRNRG